MPACFRREGRECVPGMGRRMISKELWAVHKPLYLRTLQLKAFPQSAACRVCPFPAPNPSTSDSQGSAVGGGGCQ